MTSNNKQTDSAMINDHQKATYIQQQNSKRLSPQSFSPATAACPQCHELQARLSATEAAVEHAHTELQSLHESSGRETSRLKLDIEQLLTRSMGQSLAIESLPSALRIEQSGQRRQPERTTVSQTIK